MEFVMFLTMLLFTGICTFILVLAILNLSGKRANEKAPDATTTQTSRHSQKTLV